MPPFSFPNLIVLVLVLPACTRAPAPAPTPAAQAATPPAAPTTQAIEHAATAEVEGDFGAGTPVTVTLHVHDGSGTPMGPAQFQTVHEQRLHVLIVDPSLADYRHVHPQPLAREGDWRFSFTPQFNRPYRLWLDATPEGGRQRYAQVTLNESGENVPVLRRISTQARAGDIDATLSFDSRPRAGEMASARIVLMRGGRPFTGLEPVMGAYAHIVGIAQDWRSIAHVHPLGAGPHAPGDRGGPELRFHLEPAQAGFLALHAQVRVDGRDLYFPFGIEVEPAR